MGRPPTLTPEWRVKGGKTESPGVHQMWLECGSSLLSISWRGGLAPGAGGTDVASPSSHPSQVPLYVNQAAVTGHIPNQLPWAAAGRSEPRPHSARGVARLSPGGFCCTSLPPQGAPERSAQQALTASWRRLSRHGRALIPVEVPWASFLLPLKSERRVSTLWLTLPCAAFRTKALGVRVPHPPFRSCVNFSKGLNLSEPLFLHW